MTGGALELPSMSDSPASGTTFDTTTTVREEIERLVRGRGGRPVETADDGGGLGFQFPGEEAGEPIEWDAFFDRFEDEGLALAYDSDPGDADPRDACALIDRERAEEVASEPPVEAEEGNTPERVGGADSEREAEQRSAVRTKDARDQENVDNRRDEPPFES